MKTLWMFFGIILLAFAIGYPGVLTFGLMVVWIGINWGLYDQKKN